MSNDQSHSHNHNHNYSRAFALGIGLNLVFIAVEVFYGLLANSSALIADAGHNASDVLGLFFAWFAIWLAKRKPKGRYSYGFKKSTILISMLNAILLFAAVAVIGWDALDRFKNPVPVAGGQVMIVAAIGVVINTLTALLFIKGQKDDLNIKGAFLHMAADAAVSLGVVIAGFLIIKTSLQWIDPVMSLIIIVVIVVGTWRLFVDSLRLALDAVPRHIKIDEIRAFLLSLDKVEDLHHLHVWAMSTTEVALTVHLNLSAKEEHNFIVSLQKQLKEKYKINHTTFQLDYSENCDMNS